MSWYRTASMSGTAKARLASCANTAAGIVSRIVYFTFSVVHPVHVAARERQRDLLTP